MKPVVQVASGISSLTQLTSTLRKVFAIFQLKKKVPAFIQWYYTNYVVFWIIQPLPPSLIGALPPISHGMYAFLVSKLIAQEKLILVVDPLWCRPSLQYNETTIKAKVGVPQTKGDQRQNLSLLKNQQRLTSLVSEVDLLQSANNKLMTSSGSKDTFSSNIEEYKGQIKHMSLNQSRYSTPQPS